MADEIFDVEGSFLPHFVKPESMEILFQRGVKAEHFADETIGEMWGFAMQYAALSRFQSAVTKSLLESEFPEFFARRSWPDHEYLPVLLVQRLKERFLRNQVIAISRQVAKTVTEDSDEASRVMAEEAIRLRLSVAERQRMAVFSEEYNDLLERYFDRASGERQSQGFPVGWQMVTDSLNGLKPKELAIAVAYAGVGKSWFCCQCAIAAASKGVRVYFASLENDRDLTLGRLLCLVAEVPYDHFDKGELNHEEVKRLKASREFIDALGDRLIIDTPSRKVDRTAFELYTRAQHFGAQMLIGDQLSFVHVTDSYKGATEKIEIMMPDLVDLSKETAIASLWVHQFNREAPKAMTRTTGPQLYHIALSADVERAVDFAFSLWATKDMASQEQMIFQVMKSRRTKKPAWRMNWKLTDMTKLEVEGLYDETALVPDADEERRLRNKKKAAEQ